MRSILVGAVIIVGVSVAIGLPLALAWRWLHGRGRWRWFLYLVIGSGGLVWLALVGESIIFSGRPLARMPWGEVALVPLGALNGLAITGVVSLVVFLPVLGAWKLAGWRWPWIGYLASAGALLGWAGTMYIYFFYVIVEWTGACLPPGLDVYGSCDLPPY